MSRLPMPVYHRRPDRRCGPSFRIESLEARRLLATDMAVIATEVVDALPIEIRDPFSSGSVTVEQMIQRSRTHAFVPGELVVAIEVSSYAGPAQGLNGSWDTALGKQAHHLRTLLEFERVPGSMVALVHMDLSGADVVAAMRQLESAPGVLWSAPNFVFDGENAAEFTPNDPQFASQYHHTLMQSELAWDTTLGDASIVVAVTDSGVDLDHPDLDNNIWINDDEIAGNGIDDDNNGYVDDVNGYDFVYGNNNPNPQANWQSHGTVVAGIAAAETNNGEGVAGTAGGTTIMPLQFYDEARDDLWTSAVINETYTYAADNGADIVVTSYNADRWVGDPVFAAGLQYMYDSGVLHFNSAGNGFTFNPPRTVFEQTLFVTGTDADDEKVSSSNWGEGIDIAAPAQFINTTAPGGSYGAYSGTSTAAPNAAGVAALIWSANPTWTREMVAAQLLASADEIDAQNPSFAGYLGTGRTNAFQALSMTLGSPTVVSVDGLPADHGAASMANAIENFEIRFDQLLEPATVNNPSNFELLEAGPDGEFDTADDVLVGLSFPDAYQLGTNSFDIDVSHRLGVGSYRFSLSGFGITNPFGQALDGNADTIGGDDYEHFFSVNLDDFQRVGPAGSLVSVSQNNLGQLIEATDQDRFEFLADADERVSIVATPLDVSAALTLELNDNGTPAVGSPGATVSLPLTPVLASGLQSFDVRTDAATEYVLSIYRNANTADLEDDGATPISVDDSETQILPGRFAAVGELLGDPGGMQMSHYNDASLFVDISASGTALDLDDDGEATINATVGNSLMPAGPNTVGNNGVLVAGEGIEVSNGNAAIPTFAFQNALMPFWDDVDDESGNVYWEERLVNGINTLIVQWHERPHFPNLGDATFQLQLFETGPLKARFAYQDVVFGSVLYDNGASATIGYQLNPNDGMEFSRNSAVLSAGDVIDIVDFAPTIDEDLFEIDLSTYVGQRVDFVLSGESPLADALFELRDPTGAPVAIGTSDPLGTPADNFDLGILDFEVTTPGVYEISATANTTATYSLLVTADWAFDTEPNDLATDTLRSLDNVRRTFGAIADSNDKDLVSLTLTAGQQIVLETQTPLDAVERMPPNVLDPALTIADSEGAPLASDDNSADDGKNALLQFTVPNDGTYLIEVSGQGNGEYALSVNDFIDGDFNDDGLWDCHDMDALVNEIAGNSPSLGFDLTGDGNVDLADRDAWLIEAGEINLGVGRAYLVADANLNGTVDGEDFIAWNANRFQSDAAWCGGDFNADGVTDGSDFILWNENKFQSSFTGNAPRLPQLDDSDLQPANERPPESPNQLLAGNAPISTHTTPTISPATRRSTARRDASDRLFAEFEDWK